MIGIDVSRFLIKPTDRFVLMACDGLWKVISVPDAVVFVEKALEAEAELVSLLVSEPASKKHRIGDQAEDNVARKVARRLLTHAVDDLNAKDNVTVVVVLFA
jgi:serine/threonine protein phosphatase PrpC